jgi:hypothetical protein
VRSSSESARVAAAAVEPDALVPTIALTKGAVDVPPGAARPRPALHWTLLTATHFA